MEIFFLLKISACLVFSSAGEQQYQTEMDWVTAEKVDEIIQTQVMPENKNNPGLLIESVSSAFLGTPYRANTKEILVTTFNGVDYFTLIDYVKALVLHAIGKAF